MLQIIDSNISGGAETVMLEQAQAFSLSGWIVTVVMPNPPQKNAKFEKETSSIEYIAYNFSAKGIRKTHSFLRTLIKQKEINVIHSHSFLPAILCFFASFGKSGIRTITTIHTDYRKIKDGNLFFAGRTYLSMFISYQGCYRVIAVSKEIKKITHRYFFVLNKKIVVVENGVKPEKMIINEQKVSALSAQYKKTADTFIILTIGLIYTLKGQKLLTEAIGKYLKDLNIVCIFLGPESDQNSVEELKQEITRWSLEKQVFIVGYQKDVPNWLKIADVYVHPSQNEALPLAVLEAMYMGLTPIVFDLPAYEGIVVNGKNGIIVNQNDSYHLANAIRSVYKNRNELRKMGLASQKHILKTYMLKFAIEKIEALLPFP